MEQEEQPLVTGHQSSPTNIKAYFKLFKQTDPYFLLAFSDSSLLFESQDETIQLSFEDMIGVKKQHLTQDTCKFTLNSFPFRSTWLTKNKRTIQQLTFYTAGKKAEIQELELILIEKITHRQKKHLKQLKLIAYFNPAAGSNSKAHLKRVESFVSYTNFQLEIVPTQHKNHCKEHSATIDPDQYHGVLIISGDGLMHEFVNSPICGKIPVSHVPAGSANAFSKAQTSAAQEFCDTESAVFLAVKGRTKTFNLWRVELEKHPEPIYSFLSIEWAFLADIDINSEFLRCLGGLRFEVYSVWRCIAMRRYPGKISYCYEENPLASLQQPIADPAFHTIQDEFLSAIFTTISYISDKHEISPLLKPQDKAIDMQLVTVAHGRWNLIKYLLNLQTGAHFDREKKSLKQGAGISWAKVKSYRIEPKGDGQLRGLFGIDGEHYQSQKLQVSRSAKQLLTFA